MTTTPWTTPHGCRADTGTGGRVNSWDAATGTLRIDFPRGYTYDYFGVDPADAAAVMAAEDPGCWINDLIIGSYPYLRIV